MIVHILWHLLLSLAGEPSRVELSATPAALAISGIRAQLFHHGTATLSDDLLARPKLALWNTPIGAGDAKAPSNATFVVVEVSGPASRYVAGGVQLTVSTGERTVLRRTQELGVLNAQGKTFVGFWIYNTGCEPLQLVAQLVRSGAPDRRAAIPFECGE
jgi:hypothetical protein